MTKYTVIVTSHCRPALLGRALRSIRRQTVPDLSTIVVSDDRTPETASAAMKYLADDDLFIARGGPPGPARSRNIGLAMAVSDYVLFLDDDDELADDYLAIMDAAIQTKSDRIFFCDFWFLQDGEDRAAETGAAPAPIQIGHRDVRDLHIKNFIPNSCLIYPAAAVRTKRFDETLGLNEDWDFLLNAIKDTPLAYVPANGPIIHQSVTQQNDRRGVQNEHLIFDVMPRIYRKWPAPDDTLRAARQALFASVGVALPLETL